MKSKHCLPRIYWGALERKCVEESQCESLRKHLGAFLRCLEGDRIRPGRKEMEGCKGTPWGGKHREKTCGDRHQNDPFTLLPQVGAHLPTKYSTELFLQNRNLLRMHTWLNDRKLQKMCITTTNKVIFILVPYFLDCDSVTLPNMALGGGPFGFAALHLPSQEYIFLEPLIFREK